jgi:hypothetical protein
MKARLLWLLRDVRSLVEPAEELFAIGVDQGFPYWRGQELNLQGLGQGRDGKFR